MLSQKSIFHNFLTYLQFADSCVNGQRGWGDFGCVKVPTHDQCMQWCSTTQGCTTVTYDYASTFCCALNSNYTITTESTWELCKLPTTPASNNNCKNKHSLINHIYLQARCRPAGRCCAARATAMTPQRPPAAAAIARRPATLPASIVWTLCSTRRCATVSRRVCVLENACVSK
jgi:hypothetical protein